MCKNLRLKDFDMIYIRSLLCNICFFTMMMFGCIATLFIGPLSRKGTIYFWDRVMMPTVFFIVRHIAGLKLEYRGKENILKEPALYACKHESALETYAFTQPVPTCTYVLKKELVYMPFFGWTQYFYGMVPVDRKGGAKAMKNMLKGVAKIVGENRPVVVFPEGTRCKPGTTKGYKSGFLFLAENLHLKVVPVAVNTGLFWAKSSFLRYKGTAVIEFLEPMEVLPHEDKKEFMQRLEATIEAKCSELNDEAVKKYPWVKKNLGA